MPRQFNPPNGTPRKPLQRPAKPSQRPAKPYTPKPKSPLDPDAVFAASIKAAIDALAKSAASLSAHFATAAQAVNNMSSFSGRYTSAQISNLFGVPPDVIDSPRTISSLRRADLLALYIQPNISPMPSRRLLALYAQPGTRALDVRLMASRPPELLELLPDSKFLVTVDDKLIGACYACDEAAGWADCYETDGSNRPVLRPGFTEVRSFRLRGVVRIRRVVHNLPSFNDTIDFALALIRAEFPKAKI